MKETKPITNADRIKSMTNEELAEFLHNLNMVMCSFAMDIQCSGTFKCLECWQKWLESEVK